MLRWARSDEASRSRPELGRDARSAVGQPAQSVADRRAGVGGGDIARDMPNRRCDFKVPACFTTTPANPNATLKLCSVRPGLAKSGSGFPPD